MTNQTKYLWLIFTAFTWTFFSCDAIKKSWNNSIYDVKFLEGQNNCLKATSTKSEYRTIKEYQLFLNGCSFEKETYQSAAENCLYEVLKAYSDELIDQRFTHMSVTLGKYYVQEYKIIYQNNRLTLEPVVYSTNQYAENRTLNSNEWRQLQISSERIVATMELDSHKINRYETNILDDFDFTTHFIYEKNDTTTLLEEVLPKFSDYKSYFHVNKQKIAFDSILKDQCCMYDYNIEIAEVFKKQDTVKLILFNYCTACTQIQSFSCYFNNQGFVKLEENVEE